MIKVTRHVAAPTPADSFDIRGLSEDELDLIVGALHYRSSHRDSALYVKLMKANNDATVVEDL